ncbi:hypothetical protein CB1_000602018 [Camelus ferus]|nr:hypothetical protein CB1_000602018 [Camelus ferus]
MTLKQQEAQKAVFSQGCFCCRNGKPDVTSVLLGLLGEGALHLDFKGLLSGHHAGPTCSLSGPRLLHVQRPPGRSRETSQSKQPARSRMFLRQVFSHRSLNGIRVRERDVRDAELRLLALFWKLLRSKPGVLQASGGGFCCASLLIAGLGLSTLLLARLRSRDGSAQNVQAVPALNRKVLQWPPLPAKGIKAFKRKLRKGSQQ